MTTILTAESLALKYKTRAGLFSSFEHTALEDIDLTLAAGETLGIIGRNGCGKSTLLRVLAGIIDPSYGQVCVNPSSSIALLALGVGFRPELSGYDNATLGLMYLGLDYSEAVRKLDDVKVFSELGEYFEQPMRSYSSGMKSRLMFATAVFADVDILLIDEILSVGDEAFRRKAEDHIREQIADKSVIFVSHSIGQMRSLCDRVMWLEDGRVRAAGEPGPVLKSYRDSLSTCP